MIDHQIEKELQSIINIIEMIRSNQLRINSLCSMILDKLEDKNSYELELLSLLCGIAFNGEDVYLLCGGSERSVEDTISGKISIKLYSTEQGKIQIHDGIIYDGINDADQVKFIKIEDRANGVHGLVLLPSKVYIFNVIGDTENKLFFYNFANLIKNIKNINEIIMQQESVKKFINDSQVYQKYLELTKGSNYGCKK
jgi:hypothetical protein